MEILRHLPPDLTLQIIARSKNFNLLIPFRDLLPKYYYSFWDYTHLKSRQWIDIQNPKLLAMKVYIDEYPMRKIRSLLERAINKNNIHLAHEMLDEIDWKNYDQNVYMQEWFDIDKLIRYGCNMDIIKMFIDSEHFAMDYSIYEAIDVDNIELCKYLLDEAKIPIEISDVYDFILKERKSIAFEACKLLFAHYPFSNEDIKWFVFSQYNSKRKVDFLLSQLSLDDLSALKHDFSYLSKQKHFPVKTLQVIKNHFCRIFPDSDSKILRRLDKKIKEE